MKPISPRITHHMSIGIESDEQNPMNLEYISNNISVLSKIIIPVIFVTRMVGYMFLNSLTRFLITLRTNRILESFFFRPKK